MFYFSPGYPKNKNQIRECFLTVCNNGITFIPKINSQVSYILCSMFLHINCFTWFLYVTHINLFWYINLFMIFCLFKVSGNLLVIYSLLLECIVNLKDLKFSKFGLLDHLQVVIDMCLHEYSNKYSNVYMWLRNPAMYVFLI